MSIAFVAFVVSIGAGGFGSLVGIGGGLTQIVPVLSIALGHDVKVANGFVTNATTTTSEDRS